MWLCTATAIRTDRKGEQIAAWQNTFFRGERIKQPYVTACIFSCCDYTERVATEDKGWSRRRRPHLACWRTELWDCRHSKVDRTQLNISLQNKTPIPIALTILTALRQINEVFNTDLHTEAKPLHVFLNLKEVDSLPMNSILKGKYAP